MARREIKFANLESVLSRPAKTFTDEELLAAIGNPELLAEKPESERILMVGAITHQMRVSEEFKRRAWEEFDKSLLKTKAGVK